MNDGQLNLEGVEDAYPLTAAQTAMLYQTLAAPDTGVYIGCFSAALPDDLNLAVFKSSWEKTARRHQALRTVFVWEDVDEPVQVVLDAPSDKWEHLRWPEEPEEQNALLEETQVGGVDLATAPALRLVLFEKSGGGYHFAWICHHALVDVWSAAQVMQEVALFYTEETGGPKADLGEAVPFRAFVDWAAQTDTFRSKAFWQGVLGDLSDPTTIQLPGPGPHIQHERRQHSCKFDLGAQATSDLIETARRLRVTPTSVLSTVWGIVLHRLSGQDDVVFGLAVTQRPPELADIEKAVGNFVTTIPARVRLDGSTRLRTLTESLHDTLLSARSHSTLSLNDIQRVTGVPANARLFDTILAIETRTDVFGDAQPLFRTVKSRDRSDFSLSVIASLDTTFSGEIRFDKDRFTEDEVHLIAGFYQHALRSFADHLDAPSLALPVLAPDKMQEVEAGLQGSALPNHALVHLEIQQRAAETPDRVAVVGGDQELTYGDLDAMSERWAHALRSAGVASGQRVALYVDRDPLAIVGMLAALRAGCAYVPINARQPSDRTKDILRNSAASAVLTSKAFRADVDTLPVPVFSLDEEPPEATAGDLPDVTPEHTAYVMYTSGSTGRPKGVVISHANLAASTAARGVFYPAAPQAFLMLSPIEFDSSVVGIYWTLASGGTLVLPAAAEEQDIPRVAALIEAHKVTHLLGLPSLLELIFSYGADASLTSLQTIISAGEALTENCRVLWKKHLPQARLYNEYGPTEATVWCVACEITDSLTQPHASIGRPIPGAVAYIRDAHGRSVPEGLPGELWIGGAGVAQGYLDAPDLTAEAFRPDANDANGTLYRTGDLVRRGHDGSLDYLGRVDQQVKIRGHRIELGEIESALAAIDDVSTAAVQPFSKGRDTQLAAFVVLVPGSTLAVDTLRHSLRAKLPAWMVPSRFIVLADMPRTVTGKIDRKALILPADQLHQAIQPPRTELERNLAAIWREVLWLDRDIGVDEDFELLGGHSLMAIRLVNEIERRLDLKLPLSKLGKLTTIADQALLIEDFAKAPPPLTTPTVAQYGNTSGLFEGLSTAELDQMHGYMAGWPGEPVWEGALYRGLNTAGTLPPLFWCFNWGKEFAALADALGPDQPIYGTRSGHLILDVQPHTYKWDNRRVAMQSVAEVIRLQPDGPYFLGGNCQGAGVAMETAQVLQGLAKPVGLVMMMEAITDHVFHGDVGLIFGDRSEWNPYALEKSPEVTWRARYLNYSFDTITGGHGQFFNEHNIGQLSTVISRRLADARKRFSAETPTLHDTNPRNLGGEQPEKADALDQAVTALILQSEKLLESGAVDLATRVAQAAVEIAPDHFAVLKQQGLCLLEQDDLKAAERVIEAALLQQDDPVLRIHLAELKDIAKANSKSKKRWKGKVRRLFGRV